MSMNGHRRRFSWCMVFVVPSPAGRLPAACSIVLFRTQRAARRAAVP